MISTPPSACRPPSREPTGAEAVTIVTRTGEVVTAHTVRAGSGQGRSRLELAAERDAAAERLTEMSVVSDSLREVLAEKVLALETTRQKAKQALASLRAHDAALAAHAEQVNRASVTHEAAVAECERLATGVAQAEAAVDDAAAAARVAEDRLTVALEAPRPILDASAREGMLAAVDAAREVEMRARLDVETLKERVRAGEARVVQLQRQRERERDAAAEAARRAVIRRTQREIAAEVAAALPALLDSVDRSVVQARVELATAESARTALTAELAELRAREAGVRDRLARLTESVHGLELQIHEKRLHATSVLERVASELGLDEDILISEYGPDQPIPGDDELSKGRSEDTASVPFDRAQQRKRLQDAERKLGQLGRVNPLALEEYAALEQRHKFLTEQLADLTQTRKDLLTIIDELDIRMQTIFLAAFEDTRIAFTEVFPILFPGGTGSISLTNPDDPLTTGIEVSVRPAGKKIERLSLLSGGERSLAAVALLTAIFKARPSPFYILDEVEAALDDANLGRLLGVFEQLRESSQLIVITHQKRTMEIADALYGVSMRQDGVSAVVGQRWGSASPADAVPRSADSVHRSAEADSVLRNPTARMANPLLRQTVNARRVSMIPSPQDPATRVLVTHAGQYRHIHVPDAPARRRTRAAFGNARRVTRPGMRATVPSRAAGRPLAQPLGRHQPARSRPARAGRRSGASAARSDAAAGVGGQGLDGRSPADARGRRLSVEADAAFDRRIAAARPSSVTRSMRTRPAMPRRGSPERASGAAPIDRARNQHRPAADAHRRELRSRSRIARCARGWSRSVASPVVDTRRGIDTGLPPPCT